MAGKRAVRVQGDLKRRLHQGAEQQQRQHQRRCRPFGKGVLFFTVQKNVFANRGREQGDQEQVGTVEPAHTAARKARGVAKGRRHQENQRNAR